MRFLVLLFALISVHVFSQNSGLKKILYSNISYGSDEQQKFDIALPANRGANTGVIILIHGGGWSAGDKSAFTKSLNFFAENGFACVTMNYRLAEEESDVKLTQMLDDIGKVINLISEKSAEWKISDNLFALAGHSAGGHLALLYSYSKNINKKIKTVITMSGISDLNDDSFNSSGVLSEMINDILVNKNEDSRKKASPINNISSSSVPTLLIHGSSDEFVPYSQSEKLKKKLDEMHVRNQFKTLPMGKHEYSEKENAYANSAILEWLQVYLK